MSTPALVMQPSLPPAVRRVRGYFAPVNRLTATPTVFDATTVASFDPDAPPAPWVDLGWLSGFARTSGTKLQVVESGAPGTVLLQGRQSIGATVSMTFERWSKLTMALTCGAQQTNVLAAGTNPVTITAASSTATFLSTPNVAGTIQAGDMIAVDADYNGQTSYLGAGASAAYLATAIGSDVNWIRRMTLNVGRVTAVTGTGLQLAEPLLAGVPAQGMQAQQIVALQDREGGTFFHEWSGLFCMQGEQGDALFFYYPRLQTSGGPAETVVPLTAPLSQLLLNGHFVALPVVDPTDGSQVCCYRTYLPCANAQV
ncbi:MAG TPA: hypothetical protein VGY94_04000 [Acidobacteriaceae bacterium]|jgi:hypothetical protein|nr:hypothetical protein [Acidobacteriaceae bacterium]